MAESHAASNAEVDAEQAVQSHAPYGKVWWGLLIFTLIEYFYAFALKDLFWTLILGLLLWAGIKASMVGWYFMHLKFEGAWVYALIVPAAVLAVILVLALTPDVAMKPQDEELEETVLIAPAECTIFSRVFLTADDSFPVRDGAIRPADC
jgi:cytochrome c oxidase subunit 4